MPGLVALEEFAAQFKASHTQPILTGRSVSLHQTLLMEGRQHPEGRAGIESDALANLRGGQFVIFQEKCAENGNSTFQSADAILFVADASPRG